MRRQLTSMLLGLALIATSLAARSSGRPADDLQPLKIEAEIVSQKYCPSGDKTTYTIRFTVRTRFINQSDHKIILSKDVGCCVMFHGAVASDAKNLASGNYEYNSNLSISDGTVVYLHPETPEQFNSPDSSFAILAPGESIRDAGYYWAYGAGALPRSTPRRSTLQPGDHVLSVTLWPWSHKADPIEIHKNWEPLGELIYYPIKTGPIPFHLPADPKLENCNSGLDINEP
jgi:hypothetical protein